MTSEERRKKAMKRYRKERLERALWDAFLKGIPPPAECAAVAGQYRKECQIVEKRLRKVIKEG